MSEIVPRVISDMEKHKLDAVAFLSDSPTTRLAAAASTRTQMRTSWETADSYQDGRRAPWRLVLSISISDPLVLLP